MASMIVSPSSLSSSFRSTSSSSSILFPRSLIKNSLNPRMCPFRPFSIDTRSSRISIKPKGWRNGAVVIRAAVSPSSALLFECDGVLVDTEKDSHRVSFNDTFTEKKSLQKCRNEEDEDDEKIEEEERRIQAL